MVLTSGGERRERPGSDRRRSSGWPAAVERGGSAPVAGSRWERAPWTRLDVAQLLV
jgi:hypothetical protein